MMWIEQFSVEESPSFAVKDSIDIKGLATGLGSRATVGSAAANEDAEVVRQLKVAGWHLNGKVTMHELAFGMTGVNDYCGTPVNPIFPDYIPGGSSSGSACVVSSDEADVALGTDTGGSIRVPAACCGIFGFKPTFGRVSRDGVWPTLTSLDCVGAFSKTIEQLAEVHAALDTGSHWGLDIPPLDSVKIGYYADSASAEVKGAIEKVLQSTGLVIEPVSLSLFDEAFSAGLTIIAYETLDACKEYLHSGNIGADVKGRLEKAKNISEKDVIEAEHVRRCFQAELNALFDQVDLLITPTLPDLPMRMSEAKAGKQDLNISRFVRPFNLSGHPALAMPITQSPFEGPLSLQLVADRNQDASIFAWAKQLLALMNQK